MVPNSTNDNQPIQHITMAHVRFIAEALELTPAEVMQRAAAAVDHDYSWQDIQYFLSESVQQSGKLLRRAMAMKKISPRDIARSFGKYAFALLLMGEIASRLGETSALAAVAAEAERFQESLDLLRGDTGKHIATLP